VQVRWLGLTGCAVVLLCCGPQQIQGSLSALLNLQYSSVQIGYTGGSVDGGVMTNGQVSLRFLQPSGASQNAVLIVTEDLSGLRVSPGGSVDLTEVPPSGVGQRGVVTRDVENDPRTTFPALQVGRMELDGTPVPGSGASMGGEFNVTFALCADFACGYTAYDTFKGQVQ
jgi:hypothetical protein